MYHSLRMLTVREKCVEIRKKEEVWFSRYCPSQPFLKIQTRDLMREQWFVWLLFLKEGGEFDVINYLAAST